MAEAMKRGGAGSVADAAAADLRDLALVLSRTVADGGRRTPLDDVLTTFGHIRESLAAVEDDDL